MNISKVIGSVIRAVSLVSPEQKTSHGEPGRASPRPRDKAEELGQAKIVRMWVFRSFVGLGLVLIGSILGGDLQYIFWALAISPWLFGF